MSSLEFNKMIWILKNPQNIWVVRDTDNYLVQLPHFRDEVDTSQTRCPLRGMYRTWTQVLKLIFSTYHTVVTEACLNWLTTNDVRLSTLKL